MPLVPEQRQQLDELGYVVLADLMPAGLLRALRARVGELLTEEGDQAGSEFKQEAGCRRLANLVDKGEIFQQVIAHPQVLECVAAVLGPRFKLSSLNARSVDPDGKRRQPLHVDMGALPDEHGYWVCNSIWMLDDFTTENGATRCLPGTHRRGCLPQDALGPEALLQDHPEEVLITGRAGTVVVMNAHLWHGGTANRTPQPRRALHAFYARWDKPQQQYQKQLVRIEVQQALSPPLRRLLALDDPQNDALSADVERRSGFLE